MQRQGLGAKPALGSIISGGANLMIGKGRNTRIVCGRQIAFEHLIMARTERYKIHDREAVAELPEWMKAKHCPHKKKYMAGKRIMPRNLTGKEKLTYVVDEVFLAYNSARLKEACQLFADRMLAADVTIGMSISGALTPAGLGCSCIIP